MPSTAPTVTMGLGLVDGAERRRGPSLRSRDDVCDAVVRCVARWGLSKTTIDDIAREGEVSRATVYRLFPGGRSEILEATVRREAWRLVDSVARDMAAQESLDGALLVALQRGAAALGGHPALRYLLDHEPEAVLPYLSFDGLGAVLALASEHLAPVLAQRVDDATAADIAEWVTRLVVSYTVFPLGLDLSVEEDARRLLGTHVLPALDALGGAGSVHSISPTTAQAHKGASA